MHFSFNLKKRNKKGKKSNHFVIGSYQTPAIHGGKWPNIHLNMAAILLSKKNESGIQKYQSRAITISATSTQVFWAIKG